MIVSWVPFGFADSVCFRPHRIDDTLRSRRTEYDKNKKIPMHGLNAFIGSSKVSRMGKKRNMDEQCTVIKSGYSRFGSRNMELVATLLANYGATH